jgi:hypothetical protein
MFPSTPFHPTSTTRPHPCRAIATRSVIAAIPVALVCAYATHVVLPVPRVATDAFIETASIVDSPSTIGIADSDLYGESVADIDTTLDNLQSIGVQDVRILVPWALVEPAAGSYNWTYMDEVVDAAAARGMGVLADVTSTPTWDAPAGTIYGAGTPNPTDYASFLTQVATRYGTNISSYEIWNEPNSVVSYDPIDPATYTALLKAGYTAIKAVDPSATVIAGALGAGYTLGNLTLNPVTFVQDMLADGASGYFDALSFHPYEESLEFSAGAGVSGSPLDQLNQIEALLAANGDAAAKIWVTEYGLPTADVSQQTQATYIQNFLDTWETESYAGPAFIYTAQDGTSTDPTGTYGIYNADWTPKLAVAVIQAEIAKYAKAVTAPVTTVAQQLAAYQQAVALALQTFAQQYAQALANAFAALGTPATATAAPAVQAKTLVAAVTPTTIPTTTPTVAKTTMVHTAPTASGVTAAPPVKTVAATPVSHVAISTPTAASANPVTPTTPASAAADTRDTPNTVLRPKDTTGLRFTHPEQKNTALGRPSSPAHQSD